MSNYFSDIEFACKCGRAECDALLKPHPALVIKLNVVRQLVNHPLIVNSGIRCKYWNARSGGVGDSAHVSGEAADIQVAGSRERYQLVAAALKAGFKRLGVAKTFVHLDIDNDADQEVLWMY